MDEYERYTSPSNEWRILLHDSQEENDMLWGIYEKLRLAYMQLDHAYSELSQELCSAEDGAYKLEGERDEARAIAGELFAYLRLIVDPDVAPSGSYLRSLNEAWLRIRPAVRRALEA